MYTSLFMYFKVQSLLKIGNARSGQYLNGWPWVLFATKRFWKADNMNWSLLVLVKNSQALSKAIEQPENSRVSYSAYLHTYKCITYKVRRFRVRQPSTGTDWHEGNSHSVSVTSSLTSSEYGLIGFTESKTLNNYFALVQYVREVKFIDAETINVCDLRLHLHEEWQ